MTYETINLKMVLYLLRICNSHVNRVELTEKYEYCLHFSGVNESQLLTSLILHYEEFRAYDLVRQKYERPLAHYMENAAGFMAGPAYRAARDECGQKYGGWFYLESYGRRVQIVDDDGEEIDIDGLRLPPEFTTVLYPVGPFTRDDIKLLRN